MGSAHAYCQGGAKMATAAGNSAADSSDMRRLPEHPPPGLAGQVGASRRNTWLREDLQRRLRHSPRLSRLVTTIDLFAAELAVSQARDAMSPTQVGPRWQAIADEH